MSRGSLFWANARGKLGETVFYRANGEQRNRTYVSNVKNPRTQAQMANRIQMQELSYYYRALSRRLKNAYTGKLERRSEWNEFVSVNKAIAPYVPKSPLPGGQASIHAPYIIARGSSGNYQEGTAHAVVVPEGGTPYMTATFANINLPNGVNTLSTWGEYWTEFVNLNPSMMSGNKMTIFVYYAGAIFSKQYTIDPDSVETFTYTPASSTPDLSRNILLGNQIALFVSPAMTATDAVSIGIVITRSGAGGSDIQSNSSMILNPEANRLYESMRTASALATAVASYGATEDIYLSTSNPVIDPTSPPIIQSIPTEDGDLDATAAITKRKK